MKHQDIRERLPLFAADELPEHERAEIMVHLESCHACRQELHEFQEMESLLTGLRLQDPPDTIWDDYWSDIYNRMERKLAWFVFSVGAAVLLFMGFVGLIYEILLDPGLSVLIKGGLICIGAGLVILLVSVIREQLYHRKRERYREVRR